MRHSEVADGIDYMFYLLWIKRQKICQKIVSFACIMALLWVHHRQWLDDDAWRYFFDEFEKYDYAMLGDIHKTNQKLIMMVGKIPGSLVTNPEVNDKVNYMSYPG